MIRLPETEYEQLVDDSLVLKALYAAGVDNWEGYDDAMQSLEKSYGDNHEDDE